MPGTFTFFWLSVLRRMAKCVLAVVRTVAGISSG